MKQDDKRLLNLKPMKKGETRNPNGRPKGTKNRSTIIKKFLEARLNKGFTPEGIKEVQALTVEELLTLAVIKKAKSGDVAAYKELMDGAYGKIKDKVDLQANVEHTLDQKLDERSIEVLNKLVKKIKDA